jgi:hypothetical protein
MSVAGHGYREAIELEGGAIERSHSSVVIDNEYAGWPRGSRH